MENPTFYFGKAVKSSIEAFHRGTGKTLGASGTGYEITKADRTRKIHAFISGLLSSADRHQTKWTIAMLRERCRMYDRQTSLFSGILDTACDNIVGANFDFIPKTGDPDLNKLAREYITKRMKAENCDATGARDFTAMLKTEVRDLWTAGDELWVKRSNGSVLTFEADQIVSPDNKDAGKRIVMGVELDNVNHPVAYHIKQRKSKGDFGMSKIDATTTRIPVANAIFASYRKRPNQTRGVPFLAATLETFDRLNNYIDYESLAAEINSMLAWKLTKKEAGENPIPGEEDNPDTESSFDKVQKMEPGQIIELLEGEDLDMVGANRPGDNFEPYLITMLRIVGVGIGYPLELLLKDFSKTNYSSARASMGEGRRMFRCWQRVIQVQTAMPWYRWQIGRGIASGELPARSELFKARPQWPAWEYIDPKKSAEGNKISVDLGTKTVSLCIRETGGDPNEVFVERAEEIVGAIERSQKIKDSTGVEVPWQTLISGEVPKPPAPAEKEDVEPEDREEK